MCVCSMVVLVLVVVGWMSWAVTKTTTDERSRRDHLTNQTGTQAALPCVCVGAYLDPCIQDHAHAKRPQKGQGRLRPPVPEKGEEGRDEEELEVDPQVPTAWCVCFFVLCVFLCG